MMPLQWRHSTDVCRNVELVVVVSSLYHTSLRLQYKRITEQEINVDVVINGVVCVRGEGRNFFEYKTIFQHLVCFSLKHQKS
jgi:hypothetical protein